MVVCKSDRAARRRREAMGNLTGDKEERETPRGKFAAASGWGLRNGLDRRFLISAQRAACYCSSWSRRPIPLQIEIHLPPNKSLTHPKNRLFLRFSAWSPTIAAINRGRSILCSRYLFPRVVSYYNCFKWLVVLSDLGSLSRTWTKARYIESKDMVQSGCWPHPPYIRPCTSSSPQLII